jgi:hypothetical protein
MAPFGFVIYEWKCAYVKQTSDMSCINTSQTSAEAAFILQIA